MKLVVALALLATLAVGGASVAMWSHVAPPGAARVHVAVVGPGNASLYEGDVDLGEATALSALRATGLALELREYPGMGTYVESVDGHRAHGATGWVYEVRRGAETLSGDRSAATFVLHKDDAIEWRWTEG